MSRETHYWGIFPKHTITHGDLTGFDWVVSIVCLLLVACAIPAVAYAVAWIVA